MKTAVVTDSTAYMTEEERKRLNIYMIPLQVIMGGEVYREEIDLTAEEFYEEIRKTDKLPTTSQPPIGEFVQLFEELSRDYDAVISIHLSSGISGAYQGAVAASRMVEGIQVFPFDSEITCSIQGFYVEEAAKMALQGKEPDEIMARLEEMKTTMQAYFMADDLSHLQRGGRLSAAAALIGSVLQIKPVLYFHNKVIAPFEKVRTKKKALNRISELLGEAVAPGGSYKAYIIHARRLEEAKEWKAELEARFPQVEFGIGYFGPVIGTHLGEGSMGMGWYKVK